MQKSSVRFLSVMFVLWLTISLAYGEGYTYKANKEHLGGNVTPTEAYQMIKKDPAHTTLVDCRTRAEYQYVGHPGGAYNIPIRFLSTKVGKK